MQQLTLQFDGFAPIGQSSDVSATTERRERVVISLAEKTRQKVSPWLAAWQQWATAQNTTASGIAGATVTNRMMLQGTAISAFCFVLMFVAAVLQGGVA